MTRPHPTIIGGYKLTLVDGKDTLTITVLDETRVVDGVRTRIVEERETKGGKLDKPMTHYAAEITKGGKTSEVVVTPDGARVVESAGLDTKK